MTDSQLLRREFMQLAPAGLAALAFGLGPGALKAESRKLSEFIIINALGGISNQNLWMETRDKVPTDDGNQLLDRIYTRLRSIDARAIRDAHASGTTAVNVTVGYVFGEADPYEYTINDIGNWNSIIHRYRQDLVKVRMAADIERAKREGKIGIIFGFQNAAAAGNNPERISTFANLGVRIIQLTYNGRNQLGDGAGVPENRALTPLGHEVVAALNRNKVLLDLSHSGERTCLDAIRTSRAPVTISHTGCRAINNIPRNKTDQELRLVAEGGGVVGIYFMPFLSPAGQAVAEDVVRHLEHALNVCGQDHVGIGTDGDTTAIDDMAGYRAVMGRESRKRRDAGVSARGESSTMVPLVPDLMGPAQFQKLADLLYRRGHATGTIEKVLGRNFLRVMKEVWPA